jgi:hypothetical protein
LVEEEVCFRLEYTSFGDEDGGLGSEFAIITVYVLEPGKSFHVHVTLDPGPKFLRRDTGSEVVRGIKVDEISFESWPVLAGEERRIFDNNVDFAMAIPKDVWRNGGVQDASGGSMDLNGIEKVSHMFALEKRSAGRAGCRHGHGDSVGHGSRR